MSEVDDVVKETTRRFKFNRENEKQPVDVQEYEPISQSQLMWRQFRKHRLGMIGLWVLGFIYLMVILAPFLAPSDYMVQRRNYVNHPPTKIHFVDTEGNFSLRPFVYGSIRERDPITLAVSWTEDTTQKHPIYFFVRGNSYKLFGFESNLHLFGLDADSKGEFFLFGTDRFGRDLFARTLYGGRVTLSAGVFGIILSLVIGIVMGGISGYYGGLVDTLIQRLIELLRSFPRIPLWLALSMILPPTWSSVKVYFGVVTILSLLDWTGLARVVRGQFLALRQKEFVEGARALGVSDSGIIFRHILPNIMSYLIITATLSFPGMIIGESSISFLGLGIKEPMTSWGLLLKDAQSMDVLLMQPWLMIPGIFIVISVLAFNFMGDALRDAFDPHSN